MKKPWKKRRLIRRRREARAVRRKKELAIAKERRWFPSVYVDSATGVLKLQQIGSSYWKAQSNRSVRRSADIPLRGNGYRKAFDYRWKIS